jgi:hypothetical protein
MSSRQFEKIFGGISNPLLESLTEIEHEEKHHKPTVLSKRSDAPHITIGEVFPIKHSAPQSVPEPNLGTNDKNNTLNTITNFVKNNQVLLLSSLGLYLLVR